MPYEFTAEDFNKFSEDILKAEGDQATITTILADMNTTVTDAIARDIQSKTAVETVTAENDRLKKANMELFLRVGTPVQQVPDKKESEEPQGTKAYMASYFAKLDKKE